MTEYYGKPVRTHRFMAGSGEDHWDKCVVWKCGLPPEDPIHDYKT